MTPAVAAALNDAALALLRAAEAWQETDQEAFERSATMMRKAVGMSLDEAAAEIQAFVDEATQQADAWSQDATL
jgi:hypothetical protein